MPHPTSYGRQDSILLEALGGLYTRRWEGRAQHTRVAFKFVESLRCVNGQSNVQVSFSKNFKCFLI